jgi:hypothetical protein
MHVPKGAQIIPSHQTQNFISALSQSAATSRAGDITSSLTTGIKDFSAKSGTKPDAGSGVFPLPAQSSPFSGTPSNKSTSQFFANSSNSSNSSFHVKGFADGTPNALANLLGLMAPDATGAPLGPPLGLPGIQGGAFSAHAMDNFMQPAAFPSTDYMFAGTSKSPSQVGGDNFSGGNHTFHIYEASDPRETARAVAGHLKTMSPKFSKFAK